MRTYQSADGDWIATDDAGLKLRGATELEARRTFMAEAKQTAMQLLEAEIRSMLDSTGNIIDRTAKTDRIALANAIDVLIAATPDGEYVDGSMMRKERLVEVLAVFAAFKTFLMTPLASAGGKLPIVVLSEVD